VADVDESGLLRSSNYPELSSNIRLEQTNYGVQASPYPEPVHDLRADQILMTPLFELDSLYSPVTENKLELHQELFAKRQSGEKLSSQEESTYQQLTLWRSELDTLSAPEERQTERALREAIDRYSDELKDVQ
jgi:hypothetical protein